MRVVIAALGLLLVAAPRAKAQDAEARLETVEARSLATISLESGSTVEFLEPEPGIVFVVEEGAWPAEPVLPTLDLPENATPADVHRALAPRRRVPRSMRAAGVVRAEPAPAEEPEPEISDGGDPLAPGAIRAEPATPAIQAVPAQPTIQAVPAKPAIQPVPAQGVPVEPQKGANKTEEQAPADLPKPESETRAEWFQGKFCGGGSNSWCWVNRSGQSTRQFWGLSLGAVVYSCAGTAHFKVQYRSLGKWKTYVSRDVLPGYYYAFSRIGAPRTRRSQVDGVCFHHAGSGY